MLKDKMHTSVFIRKVRHYYDFIIDVLNLTWSYSGSPARPSNFFRDSAGVCALRRNYRAWDSSERMQYFRCNMSRSSSRSTSLQQVFTWYLMC